jgi:uncharacterized protein HemX
LKPDGGTTYTQFECFQQLDGLWTAEPPPYDTTETSTSPPTDTASTTASAATSATSAPPPGDPGAGSSSSDAGPIAGGVVGGVAALGVAGAAFWFFRRRKLQKAKAAAATATQGEYSELPKTSPTTKPESQQLFEMEDQRQGVGVARHELPPQQGVVEAPGDERREPVELP